jgi:hypothetical protein
MTTKYCESCSAEMKCTPEGGCWCMELPPIMALPTGGNARCLCPSCLRKAMGAALGSQPHRVANIESSPDQSDNFETLPEGS